MLGVYELFLHFCENVDFVRVFIMFCYADIVTCRICYCGLCLQLGRDMMEIEGEVLGEVLPPSLGENTPEGKMLPSGKPPFKVCFKPVRVRGRSDISPCHPRGFGKCYPHCTDKIYSCKTEPVMKCSYPVTRPSGWL